MQIGLNFGFWNGSRSNTMHMFGPDTTRQARPAYYLTPGLRTHCPADDIGTQYKKDTKKKSKKVCFAKLSRWCVRQGSRAHCTKFSTRGNTVGNAAVKHGEIIVEFADARSGLTLNHPVSLKLRPSRLWRISRRDERISVSEITNLPHIWRGCTDAVRAWRDAALSLYGAV